MEKKGKEKSFKSQCCVVQSIANQGKLDEIKSMMNVSSLQIDTVSRIKSDYHGN